MPRKHDIKLDKYEISRNRYRELYNFCLQYNEKKERLKSLYALTIPQIQDRVQSSITADQTQKKAIAAEKLSRDISLIEQTAIEADSEIHEYVLMNVTNQVPYTYLRYEMYMPCGQDKFYKARRKFFYLLSQKK